MEQITFQVREVHQTGGDHVVSYNASVELIPNSSDVDIAVESYLPESADPKLVDLAAASIRAGILKVLAPERLGARVCLDRLVIHPVDFRPRMFELHTAEHFSRALTTR
jgi:hypothetical protein